MQLNRAGLADKSAWEAKGYALPSFDYETVKKNTKENPFWVHFGVGNIFRAFQCNVVQNLLNAGVLDRGLTVAEGYDYEIIEKMNRPHDDLSILVTLKANGTVEKSVTGSIMESLALDSHDDTQFSLIDREVGILEGVDIHLPHVVGLAHMLKAYKFTHTKSLVFILARPLQDIL